MNTWSHATAAVAFPTGLAQTDMGEVLIFRRLRRGTFVPPLGGEVLRERLVRILWASWHLLTLLGWLWRPCALHWPHAPPATCRALARLIGLGMPAGAMTVLNATRGRLSDWLAMPLVSLLIEASR